MICRRLPFALIAALLLAAPTATAFAQDDGTEEDPEPEVSTPNPYERMLSLELNGGVDTPFGVFGGALEFNPIQYLGIYAGGGVSRSGGRFAAGLHPRFPIGHGALGLMLGLGGGPLRWDSPGRQDETGIRRVWDMGLFMHAAATFEYRWDIGIFGRLMIGADALMTPDTPNRYRPAGSTDLVECADSGCGTDIETLHKPIRGFIGLTIGYALDI